MFYDMGVYSVVFRGVLKCSMVNLNLSILNLRIVCALQKIAKCLSWFFECGVVEVGNDTTLLSDSILNWPSGTTYRSTRAVKLWIWFQTH